MITIGVTIEIPEPLQSRLRRARVSFGDALGETVPAHITVLGPTEIDPDLLEQVNEHLVAVASGVEPFPVELRGTGTFRPVSPVVFVQVARGISSCEQLEKKARSGVLARELTFGYHPHVTIAHGVSEQDLDRAYEELADFRAAFVADSMALAVLGPDDEWRPVRVYPFTSASTGTGA